MLPYKTVLKDQHSGTGGGFGLSTIFEEYSDVDLDKFDVDVETYDHINIETRPVVIIAGYCKHRTPCLTIIHF